MSEVRCPHCGEAARLPAEIPTGSQLRCPWCGQVCGGEGLREQLPPVFEIVLPTGADETSRAFAELAALTAKGEDAPGFAIESDREETAEKEEETDRFSIIDSDEASGTVARSMRTVGNERRAGWEIAKIVAGALLAIPAAAMILLWLPGSWQRDPLGIGPRLGSFAPWLVPANLRPSEKAPDADSKSPAEPMASRPTSELPSLPQLGEDTSSPKRRDSQTKRGPTTVAADSPMASQHRKLADMQSGADEEPESAAVEVAADAEPEPSDKVESSPMAVDDGDAVGVYNSPHYTIAELEQALSLAESAWNAWDTLADDVQLKPQVRDEVRRKLLGTLYELGQIAVYVDPESPRIPAMAKRAGLLLEKLAGDGQLLAFVGNQSIEHLSRRSRKTRGILVFGTVVKIAPHGQLFETQVDLAARQKQRITVLSIADPRKLYGKHRRILVLGSVVEQPELKVAGYTGNAPQVVIGGMPYVLPK